MKICMITRAYTTNSSGGMEDYTEKLCENLVKNGVDVTILTSAHPDGRHHEIKNGVRIHYLDKGEPASYKQGFFKNIYKAYQKLHEIEKFDLLHSQSSATLGFLGKKLDIPMVITMHGSLFTETKLAPSIFSGIGLRKQIRIILSMYKRIILHYATKVLLKKANAIIVPSEFTKKHLAPEKSDLAKKAHVIYHGIDVQFLKREDKKFAKHKLNLDNTQVLLCLCRLVEEKGVQVAIQALKKLEGMGPVKLLIAGDGPYKNSLMQLVSALKLEKKVDFFGFVDDEQKNNLYNAADLFLSPELTNPAFGLVAAEAMACGTPVIGSNHGATEEVIGNSEFLIQPGNANELSTKINAVLSLSEQEKLNMNETFYKRQRDLFSINSMISNTVQLYENLLMKLKGM